MYSFLVLGLVPGTNLQITFNTWLDMIGLALAGFGVAYLYRHHYASESAWVRVPLHASQLHSRRSA